MLICGSSTLGRLFDSIFAHFWFNGVLCYSLKNLNVEFFFNYFNVQSWLGI